MSSFSDSVNFCHRLISGLILVLGEVCSELPQCPRTKAVPLGSTFLGVGFVLGPCVSWLSASTCWVMAASFMPTLKGLGWLRVHGVLESLVGGQNVPVGVESASLKPHRSFS